MNTNKNFMKLPYIELDEINNNRLGLKELRHLAPFVITSALDPLFVVCEFKTFEEQAKDTNLSQGDRVATALCQRRVPKRVKLLTTAEKQALVDARLEKERGRALTDVERASESKEGAGTKEESLEKSPKNHSKKRKKKKKK